MSFFLFLCGFMQTFFAQFYFFTSVLYHTVPVLTNSHSFRNVQLKKKNWFRTGTGIYIATLEI
jgi:hypothetical protein